jgi:hypothetical protein
VHVRWVLPLPDDPSWIVPERIVRAGTTDAIKDGTGKREDGEAEADESGDAVSEG